MGWFGGKSTHERQVAAVSRIVAKLYERLLLPHGDAPKVLRFGLQDSRYRYLIFCLATVHCVCARRMKNPDAVLNECQHNLLGGAITYAGSDGFFDTPPNPQQAINDGSACLGDFLDRWSAYIDIGKGGNAQAATSLVCSMLRDTESVAATAEGDARRLLPLARWIEDRFGEIDRAFVELGG